MHNDCGFAIFCIGAVSLKRTLELGPKIAANLRRRKAPPSPRWRFDEMVSTIAGERVQIWRAVDDEGEVMDMVAQKQRDTCASDLLRRLLRHQHIEPEAVITDGPRSYPGAFEKLDLIDRHRPGRLRDNNHAEDSHLQFDDVSAGCRASNPAR